MRILVISGPLGSGKTTRLNQILNQVATRHITALCIVNDVGTTNIDASRVSSVGEVLPLTTGCVCCESAGVLKRTLEEVAERTGIGFVIIEPTGIADATTIRSMAKKLGFDWHCLCLIDVQHFELNRTIGVEQFQLPAATRIGLTWAEGVSSLSDSKLAPVLEYIGRFSGAPIQILLEDEMPRLESLLEDGGGDKVCKTCGHTHDHDSHADHKHSYTHDHHHHVPIHATSVEFAEGIDETILVPVLVNLYQKHGLVRAKGICKIIGIEHEGLRIWDFVQGSIIWGARTDGTPGGNFISSSEDLGPLLKFMCKYCDNNRKAVEQMDVFTDSNLPVEKTIEAIDYLLAQYPNPITRDGRVLTNCDADPAKHLARRPGVPHEVHERAYRKSVQWRIAGFRHLVRQWETKVWPDDYAFYRACFVLGKALINTLQIDWVNDLMSAEIRQEINSLPTTELTLLGWEWMEAHKPAEIAENLKVESVYRVLRYGMEHGLGHKKALDIFRRAHQLFRDHRSDYNESEWAETL